MRTFIVLIAFTIIFYFPTIVQAHNPDSSKALTASRFPVYEGDSSYHKQTTRYHHSSHYTNKPKYRYPRPYNSVSNSLRPKEYSSNIVSPRFTHYDDSGIRQGIRSGALSWDEVRELRQMRYEIEDMKRQFWADGHLSRNERKRIERAEAVYRKKLHHELNDGEKRQDIRTRFSGWR